MANAPLHPSSADDASRPSADTIRYQRIRVPRDHGSSLQIPPLNAMDDVWQANLAAVKLGDQTTLKSASLPDRTLAQWRSEARKEIVSLALAYSLRYTDPANHPALRSLADRPAVILSGHQPELYHPGVWYKSFVLSELSQRFGTVPINLVVDSDLCQSNSVRYPAQVDSPTNGLNIGTIPFDRASATLPHEQRRIVDREFFNAFPDRVADAFPSHTKKQLVQSLWAHVQHALERLNAPEHGQHSDVSLGLALAAGRHRLELEHGLATLELPVSVLAQSRTFGEFIDAITFRPDQFRDIYNQVLREYRQIHRIRSRSHPVPSLVAEGDWIEMPFWIWHSTNSRRRSLWCRSNADQIQLSDRAGWVFQPDSNTMAVAVAQLAGEGICIRPRALMTTLCSRLLLGDLFLHGVGGAKYDQLTDAIADQFFGVRLPGYVTLSATFQLPSDRALITRSDVNQIKNQRREYRYHPERYVTDPGPETMEWIERKQTWIRSHRTQITQADHRELEQINQCLRQAIPESEEELQRRQESLAVELRNSEIAGSREYSFCLFDESLISELKQLASIRA